MDITDATPDRRQLAIERFLQGVDSIELNRVSIAISRDDRLAVSVASQWLPESVTEQTAHADLAHARRIFQHIADSSPEFRRRVASMPQRYCVVDDYGKGSVAICHLERDRLVWASGFAPVS